NRDRKRWYFRGRGEDRRRRHRWRFGRIGRRNGWQRVGRRGELVRRAGGNDERRQRGHGRLDDGQWRGSDGERRRVGGQRGLRQLVWRASGNTERRRGR